MTGLVRELAGACAERLESRGVRLVVQAGDEVMAVRGNRSRLRQMLEHLLNNAAQALAGVGAAKAGEEQVIRVSVSVGSVERDGAFDCERYGAGVSQSRGGCLSFGRWLRGAGLGLSICYGIVHEHGGEISAFNLHPHGAAVAVELPVADFAARKI